MMNYAETLSDIQTSPDDVIRSMFLVACDDRMNDNQHLGPAANILLEERGLADDLPALHAISCVDGLTSGIDSEWAAGQLRQGSTERSPS